MVVLVGSGVDEAARAIRRGGTRLLDQFAYTYFGLVKETISPSCLGSFFRHSVATRGRRTRTFIRSSVLLRFSITFGVIAAVLSSSGKGESRAVHGTPLDLPSGAQP